MNDDYDEDDNDPKHNRENNMCVVEPALSLNILYSCFLFHAFRFVSVCIFFFVYLYVPIWLAFLLFTGGGGSQF